MDVFKANLLAIVVQTFAKKVVVKMAVEEARLGFVREKDVTVSVIQLRRLLDRSSRLIFIQVKSKGRLYWGYYRSAAMVKNIIFDELLSRPWWRSRSEIVVGDKLLLVRKYIYRSTLILRVTWSKNSGKIKLYVHDFCMSAVPFTLCKMTVECEESTKAGTLPSISLIVATGYGVVQGSM